MEQPIIDPCIPYIGPIGGDGKFYPEKLIRISGIVPMVGFNISLHCGAIPFAQDVALQIYVQVLSRYISLNSSDDKEWHKEIRKPAETMIKPGERFEIIVLCKFDHYKVTINRQATFNYPQRIHYDKISHLNIHGVVSITQISFESAPAMCGDELNPPPYARLFPTPVKSLTSPNNADSTCLPPPSYETVVSLDGENANPYPVQQNLSRFQEVQVLDNNNAIDEVSSDPQPENKYKKTKVTAVSVLLFLLLVFLRFMRSRSRSLQFSHELSENKD